MWAQLWMRRAVRHRRRAESYSDGGVEREKKQQQQQQSTNRGWDGISHEFATGRVKAQALVATGLIPE
jgi:hypothetical protein